MDLRTSRQPNKTVDRSGVEHERILRLQRSRSSAKGVVTKRQRELLELMKDSNNVDQVRAKVLELELALKKFNEAHDKYHAELIDDSAIQNSIEYFESVKRMGTALIQTFDVWLKSVEFKLQEELDLAISLRPEDSISNVGSINPNASLTPRKSKSKSTTSSSLSRSSTASSARLRASAKKASLSVEAAALKKRQDIQMEELLLKQRKENLKLETELAKAEAEEKVYIRCEEQIPLKPPIDPPTSTPFETKDERTVEVSKCQKPLPLTPPIQLPTSIPVQVKEEKMVEVPQHQSEGNQEMSYTLLNPEAPEWKACKHSLSASHGESIEDGLLERHLDLSQRNVSHMVEVQRLQQLQNQQLHELLKQQQLQTLAITLPQPEIPVFSGDPVKYSDFVRAFENLIETKTNSQNSRLYYLVQYTSGEVKELMQSCLSMDPEEGYKTARALLNDRYGQSYKIATALIDQVMKTSQIKADDGPALQRFSVQLTSCKNSLKEIGYLSKIENPDTLQRIIGRLPLGLRQKWRDKADVITEEQKREVTIGDIAEFVERKARIANHPVFGNVHPSDIKNNVASTGSGRRRIKTPKKEHEGATFATQGGASENHTDHPKGNTDLTPMTSNVTCPLCKGSHWLSRCEVFRGNSVDERIKFVRSKGLCNNCLMPGHMAISCPKESYCKVVGCKIGHRKHSTFLHPKNDKPVKTEPAALSEAQPNNAGNEGQTGQARSCFSEVVACEGLCNATGAGAPATGLAIVPVNVRAKGKEKTVQTYAFLDPGSNTTFCTDKLIDRLGATGRKVALSLTTMDNDNVKSQSLVVSLEVSDLQGANTVELRDVFSRAKLPVAADDRPVQSDVDKWPYLKEINLPNIDAEVELLIGSDVPKALEPQEVKRSEDGGPYAVRTLLGWTINGPLGRPTSSRHTANRIQSHAHLDLQFERFCEMEFNDSQFSVEKGMSQEDKRALTMMEESAELRDGHYQIAIPWKVFPPYLPNNKAVAEHRLSLLKKRLKRDPELHQKYALFMDDLFEKGHARKVPDDQRDSPAWYLPHHSVIHPQKPGKVRVVFDCAAKFQNVSLNQQILQGPDLTNSLTGVLTRFREEPIAIIADIEKMFYQVRVPTEDSKYLRFLWWPGGCVDKVPEEFQMLVHLFGGVSSPSCASYALRRTADDNAGNFDEDTVRTVRRNFYVDDCLKSVVDDQQASRLVDQLRQLLDKGGFRLTKWISNSSDVIQSVPVPERAESVKELDLENWPVERALGIQWDVQSDTFRFKIVVNDRPPTRRGILSIVSSIYDPLGFVAPLILPAKAILRDLCRKGLDWDDRISPEDLARWQDWLQELPKLEQFTVERCLKPKNFGRIVSSQLHNFADASQEGYGAVSYLRLVNQDGNVHCAFLMGKSRQTPQKSVTIPRLELSAAVVATRLNNMMRRELDIAVDDEFFWSDSTCVLSYIANQDKRFQTFVANRITTIHEGSRLSQWNYVDTSSNPADDASRGLSAEEFIRNKRWIIGPAFLWKKEDWWPKQPDVSGEIKEDDPEMKKERKSFSAASTVGTDLLDRMVQSYSSWYRLKKVMAWILRYRSNLLRECRRRKEDRAKVLISEKPSPISVEEMHSAEIEILKYVQRQSFREELSCLQNKGSDAKPKKSVRKGSASSVKKSSSVVKLDPVLRDGLLCVGGRLRHAPIEEEQRHPVILPKKHHVVDLMVRHYHLLSGHSGQEYVLSSIRKSFWIIKGRVAVRRVLSRCFGCRRRQAPVGAQKMADLPPDRVTPDKPPFTFVGVDCFGPFWVKRARSQVKRYGVLFTCLVTRAIHLEVAQSMDTDSFVNSMRRFIARRGIPEVMRSDNGTNFVGGNKELRDAISEWNDKQIHEYMLQRNIKWLFNPPSGSHFGGVWERSIRTVRKILTALMKEQPLDDEGLTTLMCEVEAIVNGRPITKSSDDPSDAEALTPNHLLLLRSGPRLPPGEFSKEDSYSRRRWRQVQYLANVFWRRWIREYLPQLQERQKWAYPSRNFAVNDIVLVVDDRAPRSSWPLGRVTSMRENSSDGRVRSVTVKTRTSIYERPVDKIVLLESVEMSDDMERSMN